MPGDNHGAWIEEWARDYAALGVLGFLFSSLVIGKMLLEIMTFRGKFCGVGIVPSAILGGMIGMGWFWCIKLADDEITTDLYNGLTMVQNNLVNFVFAAFILGNHRSFYCY